MKKRDVETRAGIKSTRIKPILLTIAAVLIVIFIILPLAFSLFDGSKRGNVALIPIDGPITANGGSYLGSSTVSSADIVQFIEEAEKNSEIKVILLEINSPGGSAVASDEISSAIKRADKPVIALIREVGASGGYWIASAAEYVIANRMSITGSIGVISSYLEFSGIMDKYGVGYERLVAGEKKDLGNPYTQLSEEDRELLQGKLNRIHDFFIEEIAENRGIESSKIKKLATGEFFLGVEALELGLVDALGDKEAAEKYMKEKYGIAKPDYVEYKKEVGLLGLFSGVFSDWSFNMGEGFGSILIKNENLANKNLVWV